MAIVKRKHGQVIILDLYADVIKLAERARRNAMHLEDREIPRHEFYSTLLEEAIKARGFEK